MGEQADGSTQVRKRIIDAVTTVAIVISAGILIWRVLLVRGANQEQRALTVPSAPVSISGSPILGDARAKAVMIEFSDFECPFCGQFARDTMPLIERDYVSTGRLRVAFRHNPLPIHVHAATAAKSAACAAAQGKFWKMHDLLFALPSHLSSDDLKKKAIDAGVDGAAFDACVARDDGSVDRDLADAKALGIQSTPVFLFGFEDEPGSVRISSVLTGSGPLSAFSKTLDELLSAKPVR